VSRTQQLAVERDALKTIVKLTNVFEGIASMRISQTKTEVLQSQQFFNELWKIYSQLRVDKLFHFGRRQTDDFVDKELAIIITAEGGFSGDIDQKLITTLMQQHDPKRQDIIVVGHHGAVQLIQAGVAFKKYFSLPARDKNINVQPLVKEVRQYRSTKVFYPTYVSLMNQDVQMVELNVAVQERAQTDENLQEVISEETYIFEPSAYDVVAHLEGSMMQIALGQFILDSKLAQYASRFRSMSVAKQRSQKSYGELKLQYTTARRRAQDERLKEMTSGIKRSAQS